MALLAVYGYRWANDYMLSGTFAPIAPGQVNVVGVDTSAGYGILVENRAAKLVAGNKDAFKAGTMDESSLEGGSTDKRFIPIKEMLKGIGGDGEALGFFVMRLNDIKDPELSSPALWKAEDIEKAIAGDPTLHRKLASDINVELDGTPLDHISKNALYNGILVDIPVPIQVNVGGPPRTIVARVKRPYRPTLVLDVERRLKDRNYDVHTLTAEYINAARELKAHPDGRENVVKSLRAFYAKSEQMSMAEAATRVINSVTPVITENQIESARYDTQESSKGKRFTLHIALTPEGRKRLWQFSRNRIGSQLLLVVDGVAIAAPFIQHGLSEGEVQISGMEEESLVQDAVDTINSKRATK